MDQLAAIVRGKALFSVEMSIERAGVHASVGAPAAGDGHALLVQQQGETILQSLLHRGLFGLYLPAEKSRTIVRQMDKITHT